MISLMRYQKKNTGRGKAGILINILTEQSLGKNVFFSQLLNLLL